MGTLEHAVFPEFSRRPPCCGSQVDHGHPVRVRVFDPGYRRASLIFVQYFERCKVHGHENCLHVIGEWHPSNTSGQIGSFRQSETFERPRLEARNRLYRPCCERGQRDRRVQRHRRGESAFKTSFPNHSRRTGDSKTDRVDQIAVCSDGRRTQTLISKRTSPRSNQTRDLGFARKFRVSRGQTRQARL